jgi:hypothetical protein
MNSGDIVGGIAGLIVFVIGTVLLLLWVFLPFLVNGTNRRLDRLIDEVRGLRADLQKTAAPQSPPGHRLLLRQKSQPAAPKQDAARLPRVHLPPPTA